MELNSKKPILNIQTTKPTLGLKQVKTTVLKPAGRTETTYYDSFTIYKGQPMGLLLTLTYPEDMVGTKIR